MDKGTIDQKVKKAATLLEIGQLLDRKPVELSGGQKQRTAIGRAIVREPELFLFDEPIAHLDAKLRAHMRGELKLMQRELGTTMIYVTHDQLEALSMADRIAVMHDGVLQQFGTPEEIYRHPVNEWVGGFIGEPPMNFLDCQLEEDAGRPLTLRHPEFRATIDGEQASAIRAKANGGAPSAVKLGVRPDEIGISNEPSDQAIKAKVLVTEPLGGDMLVDASVGDTKLLVKTKPNFKAEMGDDCYLTFDRTGWHVFAGDSGLAYFLEERFQLNGRHQSMQLSRDELREAYRRMTTIREFEDTLHEEFSAGNIPGFVHLYAGEEASGSGVCMHLDDRDAIASTHRGHGHCIAKGVDPEGMMLEIYGKKDGLCGGKGGSMHIADLSKGMMGANGIVGGGPPLICGAALTAKTLKTGGVAIAFVGDGASNQGTTFESYNLAKVWNLPAIFIVEDNGYAESTASAWSVGGSQAKRAAGFDIPCIEVDGHDFFAVWEAAREAIDHARSGKGPALCCTSS